MTMIIILHNGILHNGILHNGILHNGILDSRGTDASEANQDPEEQSKRG